MEAKAKTPQELKAMYMSEIAKAWSDKRMLDYFDKEVSSIVELSDGKLMSFSKRKIETDFCFGYGFTNTYDNARDTADFARQSEEYFTEKNLDKYDQEINWLTDAIQFDCQVYAYRVNYYSAKEPLNLWRWITLSEHQLQEIKHDTERYKDLQLISIGDANLIINSIKQERTKMEKRVKTYLKKYGLSKIRTWTYDQND